MQGRGRPDLTPNNAPPSPASPGSAHLPNVNGLASAMAGDDIDAQSLASHMEQLARDPEAAARQMQLTARAVRQAELYKQKLESMVKKQAEQRQALGHAQRQRLAQDAAGPALDTVDSAESEYEEGDDIDDYIDDEDEEEDEEEDDEFIEDDVDAALETEAARLPSLPVDDAQEFLGRPLRPGETIEQYLEQQQKKAYEFLSDPEARKAALQAVRDRKAMPPPPLPPLQGQPLGPMEKTTAKAGSSNGVNGHAR